MISRRQKRDVLRACIETLETRALLSATFTTATDYATGLEPVGMVSADFNGDGRADLATVNEAGNSISILISNGDGTLRPAINVAVENTPNSIAVGDYTGDGRADLVVNGNIPSPVASAIFHSAADAGPECSAWQRGWDVSAAGGHRGAGNRAICDSRRCEWRWARGCAGY